MSIKEYQDLVTSEHQDKPNFEATVSLTVQAQVQVQNLLTLLIACFDIDDTNNCVGVFLDMIGLWAGASRNINAPISGVYFTWDDIVADGWDKGIWQDPLSPGGIVSLPDDVYRTLIKAKIAANAWDGTTQGAYDIWASVFPNLQLLIQDNQDMTMAVGLVGEPIDSLTLALFTGGYLSLKPEGVRITEYFIPVDTNPLFAWDTVSDNLAGWNEGSWAMEVPPT